ncbi:MAG: hypothetical protein J7K45_03000 [Thaumarchaeota archaeon]|nr:hypothetical protein [Nitrososphaerota archaeon]
MLYTRCEIRRGGESITLGKELLSLTLSFSAREASTCEIELLGEPPYGLGDELIVYAGSSPEPDEKAFEGVVESKTLDLDSIGSRTRLYSRDKFSILALNRVVVGSYSNADVGDVLKKVLNDFAPEVNTDHVKETGVFLEGIKLNYVTLKDAIDLLADLALFDYFSTPDLELHFFPKRSVSSGLVLGPRDLKPTPKLTDSILDLKNVVYVLGGWELCLDAKQELANTPQVLDKYYAVPFVPKGSPLKRLSFYLEKLGEPDRDFFGYVAESSEGKPGPRVCSFTIPKASISSPAWYSATVDRELEVGKEYWIVLGKVGDSDTYRLYHDGSSSETLAESQDSEDWILHEGSWNFSYRLYHGVPLVTKAEDPRLVKLYGKREGVIVDRSVTDRGMAKKLALANLYNLGRPKRSVSRLTVLNPSSIPKPNTLIKIDSEFLKGEYLVKKVKVRWRGGLEVANEMELEVVS